MVAKVEPHDYSPLTNPESSRGHLKALFTHIRKAEPKARDVRGCSWLYNLSAYRSLYPVDFTRNLPAATTNEFKSLSLWGQFFNRHWQVKPHFATQLRTAVSKLDSIDHLRLCFPYQVLTPTAPIETFFTHFGV